MTAKVRSHSPVLEISPGASEVATRDSRVPERRRRRWKAPRGSLLRQKSDFIVTAPHNYLTDAQKLRCTAFPHH